MLKFKTPIIPPEILPQIQKPPLLKGESSQEYNDLLAGLVSDIAPADFIEWLWLIQFLDCSWKILRNRRYRAVVIDLQRGPALRSVILKTAPCEHMTAIELEQAFARWTANPEHFNKHGVDPQSVPAMAFVQAAAKLEIIDKILERLQRRCDSILQQLEYRREVFASRARHAADNVLNAKSVEFPRVASADAPLAIDPLDQTTPDRKLSNEATIVPASSSESGTPSSEGTSPETPTSTPSSDL
jgi:hypothetical protein